MLNNAKKRNGYTLVESLATMLIISIVAVGVGTFNNSYNKSLANVIKENSYILDQYAVILKIRSGETVSESDILGSGLTYRDIGEGLRVYEGKYFKLVKYIN